MNHEITVGGLLLSLSVIVGIAMVGFGALMIFAAGMSDAGDDGTAGNGCFVACLGLAFIGGGIWGLL